MAPKPTPRGPIPCLWAFIVGVDSKGNLHLIDHEYALEVRAVRPASLDDIHSACAVASKVSEFALYKPSPDMYTVAFVVFQVYSGQIAASPDVFEDLVPVTSPGGAQMIGAFSVLQGTIIAQKAADLAAEVAVQATMSALANIAQQVEAADPDAPKKSAGGLFVA